MISPSVITFEEMQILLKDAIQYLSKEQGNFAGQALLDSIAQDLQPRQVG